MSASVCAVDDAGVTRWTLDGVLHRDDGPAVIWADGSTGWYRHGVLHRDDGPAEEHAGGYLGWYDHDRQHRLDGPARVWHDGTEEWFLFGRFVSRYSVATYLAAPVEAREMVATLYANHTPMAAAVTAATKLN